MKEEILTILKKLARQDLADATWMSHGKRILLAYMHAHPKQPRASLVSWFSPRSLPGFRCQAIGWGGPA